MATGLWLVAKRLEKNRFVWPPVVDGAMTLTPAQMEPETRRSMRTGDNGVGAIEIVLPNGARVSVDAFVNEKALSRVLRAMKGST
jgi:hypothetical protein